MYPGLAGKCRICTLYCILHGRVHSCPTNERGHDTVCISCAGGKTCPPRLHKILWICRLVWSRLLYIHEDYMYRRQSIPFIMKNNMHTNPKREMQGNPGGSRGAIRKNPFWNQVHTMPKRYILASRSHCSPKEGNGHSKGNASLYYFTLVTRNNLIYPDVPRPNTQYTCWSHSEFGAVWADSTTHRSPSQNPCSLPLVDPEKRGEEIDAASV